MNMKEKKQNEEMDAKKRGKWQEKEKEQNHKRGK